MLASVLVSSSVDSLCHRSCMQAHYMQYRTLHLKCKIVGNQEHNLGLCSPLDRSHNSRHCTHCHNTNNFGVGLVRLIQRCFVIKFTYPITKPVAITSRSTAISWSFCGGCWTSSCRSLRRSNHNTGLRTVVFKGRLFVNVLRIHTLLHSVRTWRYTSDINKLTIKRIVIHICKKHVRL